MIIQFIAKNSVFFLIVGMMTLIITAGFSGYFIFYTDTTAPLYHTIIGDLLVLFTMSIMLGTAIISYKDDKEKADKEEK